MLRERVIPLIRRSYAEWRDHGGSIYAAGLACFAALSVAPMLVLSLTLLAAIANHPVSAAGGALSAQLSGQIGPTAAKAVEQMVTSERRTQHQSALRLIWPVALAVFAGLRMLLSVRRALDVMWTIPMRAPSNVWVAIRTDGIAVLIVLLLSLFLIALLPINAAIHVFAQRAGHSTLAHEIATRGLDFVGSTLVLWIIFTPIFRYLPNAKLAWSDVLAGAGGTALLFAAGQVVIGWYLSRNSVTSTYGAAASLVVVLLWLYYSASIFLFGAEMTQVYTRHFGSHSRQGAVAAITPAAAAALAAGTAGAHAARTVAAISNEPTTTKKSNYSFDQ